MSESEIKKEMGIILWNNYFVNIEINEKMIRQQVKALTDKFHIIFKTDDPSKHVATVFGGDTLPKLKWRE